MTKTDYVRVRKFIDNLRRWKAEVWFWKYMGLDCRELNNTRPKY